MEGIVGGVVGVILVVGGVWWGYRWVRGRWAWRRVERKDGEGGGVELERVGDGGQGSEVLPPSYSEAVRGVR